MINKNELLNQLKRLEKWNNSDVPQWVIDVINGMPERRTDDRGQDVGTNDGN